MNARKKALSLLESVKADAVEAFRLARHHKTKGEYHEAERENGDEYHFNHHDHLGSLHMDAERHFRTAGRRYNANDAQGGAHSMSRGHEFARHAADASKTVEAEAHSATRRAMGFKQ
jgi:hypothetical protein